MNSNEKQRIGFIGAGKAGVSLAAYFHTKGLKISGFSSLSIESAQAAAEITSSTAFQKNSNLIYSSEIIFISTPDSAIADVWQSIMKHSLKEKIICHLSGSLSSDVFCGIEGVGALGYSIHPMFTFCSKKGDFDGIQEACFSVEGPEERIDDIKKIFERTGNRVFTIDKNLKTLYHAANVMASNFVTALLSIAVESFEKCSVSKEDSVAALLPLIRGNIENLAKKGFLDSLTGPAERNDISTIVNHLRVLKEEEKLIYNLLTKKLVRISKLKHPCRDYSELLKLLN